jgi:hypothetical protein
MFVFLTLKSQVILKFLMLHFQWFELEADPFSSNDDPGATSRSDGGLDGDGSIPDPPNLLWHSRLVTREIRDEEFLGFRNTSPPSSVSESTTSELKEENKTNCTNLKEKINVFYST